MKIKILIAAGGTGGHIFPAIALGEALASNYPEVEFRFLCGKRDLERRLYAENGITPIILPARQIGGGFVGRIRGAGAAIGNLFRSILLIKRERFDAVIGMGGYVAGPAVVAGILMRKVTAIHEANSIPGKTNRWLAPYVDFCAVHFPQTARHLRARRIAETGMPIRGNVIQGDREEAIRLFELEEGKRTLLILGGSQGARYLYDSLMNAIPLLDTIENADLQILWSAGAGNYDELQSRLRGAALHHISVKLEPFISRMDHALALADAAVARAGASTIAELLACGIRALYIPFPGAIYDHQTLNARAVLDAGLGELAAEKELTPDSAAACITRLVAAASSGKLRVPSNLDSRQASARLANEICRFATGSR